MIVAGDMIHVCLVVGKKGLAGARKLVKRGLWSRLDGLWSNVRINHLTNIWPLVNTVRQSQLHFYGHILRMPEEEPCRRYALYVGLEKKCDLDFSLPLYHMLYKVREKTRSWFFSNPTCMFQLTAERDQNDREQTTYPKRSFLGMQKMIWTKMQLPH